MRRFTKPFPGLVAGLIIALLLAACSGGATETPGEPTEPAGTPEPTSVALPEDIPTPMPRPAGTFEGQITNNLGQPTRVFMNYIIDLPPGYEDASDPLPLIVMLHGAGQEGLDLASIEPMGRTPGLTAAYRDLPFVFLIPQLPAETLQWGQMSPVVEALIEDTLANYNVDPDRVYMLGYSKGGYGAMTIASEFPDRYRAVVSLAGYYNGPIENLCQLDDTPTLLIHGDADEIIPLDASEQMYETMNGCDAPVELRVVEGGTHISVIQEAIQDNSTYWWLLDH